MYTKKLSLFSKFTIGLMSLFFTAFILHSFTSKNYINIFEEKISVINVVVSVMVVIFGWFFLIMFLITTDNGIYKRNNKNFTVIELENIAKEIKNDLKSNFEFNSIEVKLKDVRYVNSKNFSIKYSVEISHNFDDNDSIKQINEKVKNKINSFFKDKMGFEPDEIILKIIV